MSLTVSPGFTDVRSWTGVAASIADFLDPALGSAPAGRPPLPVGAIKAAEQFCSLVIEGTNIGSASHSSPFMVGICNLSIAVDVLSSLPETKEDASDLSKLQRLMKEHLETLRLLSNGKSISAIPQKETEALFHFFDRLMRQGLAEEETAIAFEERPDVSRTQN